MWLSKKSNNVCMVSDGCEDACKQKLALICVILAMAGWPLNICCPCSASVAISEACSETGLRCATS